MNCPGCKSDEVWRVPRRNIWDDVKASMGLWPYRCEACRRLFAAARRYSPGRDSQQKTPSRAGQEQPEREQRGPRQAGPEMAFRSDPMRPMAKVVIQADDHVQLDKILMALHRAVSSYQQPTSEQVTTGAR